MRIGFFLFVLQSVLFFGSGTCATGLKFTRAEILSVTQDFDRIEAKIRMSWYHEYCIVSKTQDGIPLGLEVEFNNAFGQVAIPLGDMEGSGGLGAPQILYFQRLSDNTLSIKFPAAFAEIAQARRFRVRGYCATCPNDQERSYIRQVRLGDAQVVLRRRGLEPIRFISEWAELADGQWRAIEKDRP